MNNADPGITTSNRGAEYGFDISQVTWGYRDKFRRMIDNLFTDGFISEKKRDRAAFFFNFLRDHTGTSYDDVAHNFLKALNSDKTWILRNPRLFRWWCATGRRLARKKLFAGSSFFKLSASGGLGSTPAEVSTALTHIDDLIERDRLSLALGFISSYRALVQRMTLEQIRSFVQEAENVYERSEQAGVDFIEGKLESSEAYIRRLTSEALLSETAHHLKRIVKSISGRSIDIDNLGKLDSDELLEKGSLTVAFSGSMYLPVRVTDFGSCDLNRTYYRLTAVMCGCIYLFRGFAALHAEPGCRSLNEYLLNRGYAPGILNEGSVLFELCEYARIVQGMQELFPGSRNLIEWGVNHEFTFQPPREGSDIWLQEILTGRSASSSRLNKEGQAVLSLLRETASKSSSFEETAGLIKKSLENCTIDISTVPPRLRRVTFFPDPRFNAELSAPPLESMIADMDPAAEKSTTPENSGEEQQRDSGSEQEDGGDTEPEENGKEGEKPGLRKGFLYDEWNGIRGEYYKDWCFVQEKKAESLRDASVPAEDGRDDVMKIKNIFERVKPDESRKEKYLYDGDAINIDKLIGYITLRKADVQGKANFYEKALVKKRSLAVSLIIDISGSTGGEVEEQLKILDIEKQAASVLAEGLSLLGDRFALYGFTGNGREHCEFHVFKEFDQKWDSDARAGLFSVYPGTSTRIGVALRHAGQKMKDICSKKKLILLVTDGKPMDSEYDPNTGYAYYDVRKACAENNEYGIETYGIITDDENRDNLEKMLPNNRFSVIRDIRDLPEKLARFFLHVTV